MNLKKINTKLAKHCVQKDVNPTQLAGLLGCSYSAVLHYLKDQDDPRYRMPPLPKQKALYFWSNGEITPNDLVPLGAWGAELMEEITAEEAAA